MPKLVYIAHPIAGNVEENVRDILKICKEIHTPDIIPIAPYLIAIQYLKDRLTEERELGIVANIEFFRRKLMDEIWLCGPRISAGMREEIKLGLAHKIPIKCHNTELQTDLDELEEQYNQNRIPK